MTTWWVQWDRTERVWRLLRPEASNHATKQAAVRAAAQLARRMATLADPVSLRIRTRSGRIAEERTYPRGADPRRSRG